MRRTDDVDDVTDILTIGAGEADDGDAATGDAPESASGADDEGTGPEVADATPGDAADALAPATDDGAAVRADGGTGTVSDFETVAESQLSREERWRRFVDETVLTPARIVWADWRARIAVGILSGYLLMALVAWVSAAGVWVVVPEPAPGQGPYGQLVGAFKTMEHPLGTTYLGEDILSQVVHATPPMLKMIAAGAVFSTSVATVVGTVSGYKGGWIDQVLMAIADIMMTIPGLPLIIVLAAVLEPTSPYVIGVLLTVNAWAGLSRSLRSQVLTLRDAEYVEASRVMGLSTPKIILNDIIPNIMPYISMNFVSQARGVIFGSVALYFLGVLPSTGTTNWGLMMNNANSQAGAVSDPAAFYWLAIPMAVVIVLALGLTLFAQAADRLFNPRVRARHAKTASDAESEDAGGDDGSGPTAVEVTT